MRMLVVDDGGDVRAAVAGLASLLLAVPDAPHALAVACSVPPDVIVARVKDASDLDWIALLRASCQTAGLVVVPDDFNEQHGRAAIAAGANLYIERWPHNLADLLTAAASTASSSPPLRCAG